MSPHNDEHPEGDGRESAWMPPLHGRVLPRMNVGGEDMTRGDSLVSQDLWVSMETLTDGLDLASESPVRVPRAWSLGGDGA
jgi:hypothetical protein